MRFTTLSNYYLIDWWCDIRLVFVCLRDDLVLAVLLQQFQQEIGGLELASTITLVSQANRLTKCASHPYFITNLSIAVKGPIKSIELDVKTIERGNFIKKTQIFWKAAMLFFYYFETTIYTKIISIFFNKIFAIWVGGVIEKATTSPILFLLDWF